MQSKKKKRYCILLVIFLFALFICFDHFRTDERMSFFGTTNSFEHILTEAGSISGEDVCTVEMLGNTLNGLLLGPSSIQNSESQRKSRTLSCLFGVLASLQAYFHFFKSAETDIDTDCASVAEVIHFIHDKDGKKRV